MSKEKQFKRQNEFIKEKYDRFSATFPKGKKAKYEEHAKSKGMSLNGYINNLIEKDMESN